MRNGHFKEIHDFSPIFVCILIISDRWNEKSTELKFWWMSWTCMDYTNGISYYHFSKNVL